VDVAGFGQRHMGSLVIGIVGSSKSATGECVIGSNCLLSKNCSYI
jgi:hypothetical protein